jgi:hypothetical protein
MSQLFESKNPPVALYDQYSANLMPIGGHILLQDTITTISSGQFSTCPFYGLADEDRVLTSGNPDISTDL